MTLITISIILILKNSLRHRRRNSGIINSCSIDMQFIAPRRHIDYGPGGEKWKWPYDLWRINSSMNSDTGVKNKNTTSKAHLAEALGRMEKYLPHRIDTVSFQNFSPAFPDLAELRTTIRTHMLRANQRHTTRCL